MKLTHTPTPYVVGHYPNETYVTLPAGKFKARAVCRVFHLDPEQRRVDAEFIATACSNHDALVAALNELTVYTLTKQAADAIQASAERAAKLIKGLK